jgi:hypothetical protein
VAAMLTANPIAMRKRRGARTFRIELIDPSPCNKRFEPQKVSIHRGILHIVATPYHLLLWRTDNVRVDKSRSRPEN